MKNFKYILGFLALAGIIPFASFAQNVATEVIDKSHIYSKGKYIRLNSGDDSHYIKMFFSGTTPTLTTDTGALTVTNGISGTITGNASTATALAANPSDCSSNQFANAIAASGNLTCASLADADIPNTITIDNATTASALAANPTDCSAGQYATTIAANGNLTCSALDANDGNVTNVGDISLDSILSDASTGQIVIGGAGGAANNERLTLDFETTANNVVLSTSTGVTQMDFGSLTIKTTGGLDLAGSNINGANQVLANGDITSADTGDIGWSRVTAANQACNTTCTFACVFGQETTSKDILSCSDATADVCVCAGAN